MWVLAAGLAAWTSPVLAQQVVGTGTAGSCTEAAFNARYAAAIAAPAGPNRTIQFNCGGGPVTIPFTSTKSVSSSVTIDGVGQQITLDGQDAVRHFRTTYQFTPGLTLTLRNLTIRRGRAPSSGGSPVPDHCGGAILLVFQEPARWSTLSVDNVTFSDNVSPVGGPDVGGGAIYAIGGNMVIANSRFLRNRGGNGGAIGHIQANFTVTDSVFENNSTNPGGPNGGHGGAINTDGSSYTTLTVRRCTFRNNSSTHQGGAIDTWMYGQGSGYVIEDSLFENNAAISNGGAIFHMNGSLTITGSTFSGNTTVGQGGALWTQYDAGRPNDTPLAITNSTFVGNRATQVCDGCYSVGGAIRSGASTFTLSHTTIVGNFAGWTGGGIASSSAGTSIRASIISNNTAANGGHPWNIAHNCTGTMNEAGYNVQWPTLNPNDGNDRPCTSAVTFINPHLGTLGNYGGLTPTVPLLTTSTLVNVVTTGCPPPTTDQRGVARPQGGGCDIGAYEFRPSADVSLTKSALGTAADGQPLTWRLVAANAGPQAVSGAVVADTFPAQMTGVTWSCTPAGGGTCPASGSGNLNASVTLPAGASATFTATGTVSGLGAMRQVVNSASLTIPAGTDDPNLANNQAGAAAQVQRTLRFFTLAPCRVLDTRGPAGPSGGPVLGAGQSRTFPVSGRCNVPSTAWAVAANVTAVAPSTTGHVRVYPGGTPAPNASTVNFSAGQNRANSALLALSAAGEISALAALPSGTMHLVVDVVGYFTE